MATDYKIPDHIEVVDPADLPDDDPGFEACEEGDNLPDEIALGGGAMAFGTTSRHVLATWLPAAFDKWGIKYKVVAGWENRGRPISAGYFDPNGSLTHHAGTKSSATSPAPSLKTLIEGRSDLKGPLCQVATDYNGVVYIIAAGRANHAGKARATMGNPAGDGNAMYIGDEVMTSGLQTMPPAQYNAAVLVAVAIADHFKQTNGAKAGLHSTTSLSGKWDLGAGNGRVEPYSITKFRADVTARLKAGPPGKPKPITPPTPTAPVVSKEITVLALVRATSVGPKVWKTDGFRRQHIGKLQLAGLLKSGLKITELANQTEVDAYGPEEPNPAGQK